MKEKKPINVEIGMRVQQAREAAGLTQERFAELIGLGVKQRRNEGKYEYKSELPESDRGMRSGSSG